MAPPGTVDTYLARQAIFDRSLSVFGYELFFRSGTDNFFSAADGDQASAQVLEACLNTFGLGRLTVGRRVFVNATKALLVQNYATLLPPKTSAVEILPTVPVDDVVVAACRALKKQGYLIALDDFRASMAGSPLVALADVLKVDVQACPVEERRQIVKRFAKPGLFLLAKKLGARKELTEAMEMGYTLYQGFFFCRPEMITRKEVPALKANYLRFLGEVNKPEADFDELERLIRQDVALSLKLLRYINSAMVGLRSRVESIKQAITLVGLNMIRRWISLLTLSAMSADKPQELIVTSLVRARFCEQVGTASGLRDQSFDLFMVGMLSVIDAILDRPMLEVLADLPLADRVKGALMGKPEGMGKMLGLALAYEHAEWDRIPKLMENLPLDVMRIPSIYKESVEWADQIFQISSQ